MHPENNPLLQQALKWASVGVQVIPLGRLSNRPHQMLGSGWSRRTVGSTDPLEIETWWTADPAANLGLVNDTGGLLIIDIDMKNGVDGLRSVDDLEAWAESELPATAWVNTPSGGRHIYLRTGLPNGTLRLPRLGILPGIDIPWQVAAPPSGRQLHVVDSSTGEVFTTIGEYWAQPTDDIPEAPAWLLTLLSEDGLGGLGGPLMLSLAESERLAGSLPPLETWMDKGFGFFTGSRNQDAFKLASKLFNQMGGDENAVRLTMYSIWQQTPQPPVATTAFPWFECEKCISQAHRYYDGGNSRDLALYEKMRTSWS